MNDNQVPYIVHLCSAQEWQSAQDSGEYRADSLGTAGFIHFSKPDQVLKVANQYYPAARDKVLLWIDPARLQAELRWEASDGDIFPHLYGPLNLEAVAAASQFLADPDGVFRSAPVFPPSR